MPSGNAKRGGVWRTGKGGGENSQPDLITVAAIHPATATRRVRVPPARFQVAANDTMIVVSMRDVPALRSWTEVAGFV